MFGLSKRANQSGWVVCTTAIRCHCPDSRWFHVTCQTLLRRQQKQLCTIIIINFTD